MTLTLSDQQTQQSVKDFVSEARQCANKGLGFAAMVTIFTVILAVAEAAYQKKNNRDLVTGFVRELVNRNSWLIAPGASPTDEDLTNKLTEIRNGLAHVLSLPPDVYLVNTIDDARLLLRNHSKKYSGMYLISTIDFVDVAEATVKKIVQAHPTARFDPFQRGLRGPAHGFTERQ